MESKVTHRVFCRAVKITDVVFMKIKMRSVEAQKDNAAELSYEEERASFFIVTNIRNQN